MMEARVARTYGNICNRAYSVNSSVENFVEQSGELNSADNTTFTRKEVSSISTSSSSANLISAEQ